MAGFDKSVFYKGRSSRTVDIIIASWLESILDSYYTYMQLWVGLNNQILLDSLDHC